MKRYFFAATVVAVNALSVAHAAPPFTPGTPNWTGSYGGVSGGYGWGHSDQTDPGIPVLPTDTEGPVGDGHYGARGGMLGGSLGYNWQQGAWVWGVEGDFSWADIKGSSAVCGPTTVTPHPCGTKLDALGTFRGRVGYAAGNWLLYATGGLAVGDVKGWDALTPAFGSDWRAGWTVGAGVETAIAPNWTAKLEYLYIDLGSAQVFNIVPGVPESVGLTSNILRAGINYRFGGPAALPPPPPLYTKAPYTKAPPIVVGNAWSGWYGGLNAGYIDGSRNVNTDAVVVRTSTFRPVVAAMAAGATNQLSTGQGGFLGGAQFGYNYMVSPMILAGLEADIQGSSLRGSATASSITPVQFSGSTFATTITTSRALDYLGTIRGRLGATVTPGLLLYATGGLAFGGVKSSTTINQISPQAPLQPIATSGSFSDTRVGYAVGAGGEWMFMSKWSAKAEYLYYDLGSANYGTGISAINTTPTGLPGFGVAAIATSSRVNFNGNIVRVGLNYHLN